MKPNSVPPPAGPVPKGEVSFWRKLATQAKADDEWTANQKSKAGLATARKLMKLAKLYGLSVSGVSIGPNGAVSVTTNVAGSISASSGANPWDQELA